MKQWNVLLFFLATIYTLLSGALLGFSASLIIYPFSETAAGYAPLVPLLLVIGSATAFLWSPRLTLLQLSVRLPLPEEEAYLQSCITSLERITGKPRRYRLLIWDSEEANAFATGYQTIAVSAGMLSALARDELEAVLAHETAHLLSGDTILGSAVLFTKRATDAFYACTRKFWIAIRPLLLFWFLGTQLLLIVLYQFADFNGWLVLAGIVLPLVTIPHFNRFFEFLFLAEGRCAEYRRDRYAQQLGYGPALSSAFRKFLVTMGSQPITLHQIYFYSPHPILHHRIRRLEARQAMQ